MEMSALSSSSYDSKVKEYLFTHDIASHISQYYTIEDVRALAGVCRTSLMYSIGQKLRLFGIRGRKKQQILSLLTSEEECCYEIIQNILCVINIASKSLAINSWTINIKDVKELKKYLEKILRVVICHNDLKSLKNVIVICDRFLHIGIKLMIKILIKRAQSHDWLSKLELYAENSSANCYLIAMHYIIGNALHKRSPNVFKRICEKSIEVEPEQTMDAICLFNEETINLVIPCIVKNMQNMPYFIESMIQVGNDVLKILKHIPNRDMRQEMYDHAIGMCIAEDNVELFWNLVDDVIKDMDVYFEIAIEWNSTSVIKTLFVPSMFSSEIKRKICIYAINRANVETINIIINKFEIFDLDLLLRLFVRKNMCDEDKMIVFRQQLHRIFDADITELIEEFGVVIDPALFDQIIEILREKRNWKMPKKQVNKIKAISSAALQTLEHIEKTDKKLAEQLSKQYHFIKHVSGRLPKKQTVILPSFRLIKK